MYALEQIVFINTIIEHLRRGRSTAVEGLYVLVKEQQVNHSTYIVASTDAIPLNQDNILELRLI